MLSCLSICPSNRGTGPFENSNVEILCPHGSFFFLFQLVHLPHLSLGNDAILQLNSPFGSEGRDGMRAPGLSGQSKIGLYVSKNYLVLFLIVKIMDTYCLKHVSNTEI